MELRAWGPPGLRGVPGVEAGAGGGREGEGDEEFFRGRFHLGGAIWQSRSRDSLVLYKR